MVPRLHEQIRDIRKDVSAEKLVPRVPAPQGQLTAALASFAKAVKTLGGGGFDLSGRMPMRELRDALGTQIDTTIDRLPTSERVKQILKVEVPFGVSTAANLIEVVPRVNALRQVDIDPVDYVRGKDLVLAANHIGLCPGQVAPTIRRNLTIYRDDFGVDWVRRSGAGNEKHDRYVEENFDVTRHGHEVALRLTDAAFARARADAMRYRGIAYGGCPAIKFLMDAGYGNLLTGLVKAVRDACVKHFDFEAPPDELVERDSTEQIVYDDPPLGNVDLYR